MSYNGRIPARIRCQAVTYICHAASGSTVGAAIPTEECRDDEQYAKTGYCSEERRAKERRQDPASKRGGSAEPRWPKSTRSTKSRPARKRRPSTDRRQPR